MGYGDRSSKWPRKCFNGLKNWQLKWFEDRELRVNPWKAQFITLSAFVDYDKAKKNEPCVVRVGPRLYLQYNRARKFNKDVEEKVRGRIYHCQPDINLSIPVPSAKTHFKFDRLTSLP